MKILFYSDLHIKDNSSYQGFNTINEKTGLTRNLLNINRGLSFVRDMVISQKPDLLINLGDTFNNPDSVTTRSLITAFNGLSELQKACRQYKVKHYILEGNHDILSSNFNLSNTKILNGYCNKVINTLDIIDFDTFRIGFIPYNSDHIKMYDQIEEAVSVNCNLICTHCEFSGAIYENGIKSESMMKTKWGIPVFSGHIHLPQKINDVIYVGSLIQGRFDSPKLNRNGILLYDSESKESKHYFNNYSKHLIKIKNLKEFKSDNIKNLVGQIIINENEEREDLNNFAKNLGLEDFIIIKKYEQKVQEEETQYNEFNTIEPKDLLESYIENNNLEAIDVFKKICEV